MPLDDTSRPQEHFDEAVQILNLTPQEQYLYQHHLRNLAGPGHIVQPSGAISTLLQANVEGPGGQSYNIPTVWYGRQMPIPAARALAASEGWDKWPAYPDAGEAERRYNDMHEFMERDITALSPSNGYQRGGNVGTKVKRDAFLYEDPRRPDGKFAQCQTCRLFLPRSELCAIIGVRVAPEDSCGLYVHGDPTEDQKVRQNVTAKEAGLVRRQVRCENCKFFKTDGICGLYEDLNKRMPQVFDLDTKVDKYGCCNAQTPRTGYASGGHVRMQGGGADDDEPLITESPVGVPAPYGGVSPYGTDALGQALALTGGRLSPGPAVDALNRQLAEEAGKLIRPDRPTPYDAVLRDAIARLHQPQHPDRVAAPIAHPFQPDPTIPKFDTPGAQILKRDPETGLPLQDQQIPGQLVAPTGPSFQPDPKLARFETPGAQLFKMDPKTRQLSPSQPTHPADDPSIVGAGLRTAVRSVIPGAAGMVGWGVGAEAGAAVGSLFPGPGTVIGAIIGGLAGGWYAGSKAGEVQDKLLDALPEGVKSAIGQSEKQRAADYAAHPYATDIASIGTQLMFMRPGMPVGALRPGATAFEQLLHDHPRIVGAALMAGQEAAQRAAEGQPQDPKSLAMSAAAGAFFGRTNALGERLARYGAAPVRRVLGPFAAQAPGAAQQQQPPPPPGSMPEVGSTVTIGGYGENRQEIRTFTVDSIDPQHPDLIWLRGEDGTRDSITSADLAQRRVGETTPPDPDAVAAEAAAQDPYQQVRATIDQFRNYVGRSPTAEELHQVTGLEPVEVARQIDRLKTEGVSIEPPQEEGVPSSTEGVTFTPGAVRDLQNLGYTNDQIRTLSPMDAVSIITRKIRAQPTGEAEAVAGQQEQEAEQTSEALREKLEESGEAGEKAADTLDQNIDDIFATSPDETGEAPGIKVGDAVQWTSGGVDQFATPERVTAISEDGLWAWVEGSTTGIPVSELTAIRAAPVDEVTGAQQRAAEAAPTPGEAAAGTEGPRPAEEVRQDVDGNFAVAQQLGLVDDIARLAGEGRTEADILRTLRPRMQPLWDYMAANGQRPMAALNLAKELIRATRLKLGIPDPANTEEFQAWQQRQRENKAAATPPPTRAPREPENLEISTGKDKNGNPIWRVPLAWDDPDWSALIKEARKAGGRYERRVKNVVFNNEEAAEKFAARVREVLEDRLTQERANAAEATDVRPQTGPFAQVARDQELALRALGYSDEQIRGLSLEESRRIINEEIRAPTAAEAWRPVEPGEIFQPGHHYRMNVATGVQETTAPRAAPTAEAAAAPAAPVAEAPAAEAAAVPPELQLHPDVRGFSDPQTGENRWDVRSPIDANHPDFAYFTKQAQKLDGRLINGRFVFDDPDNASAFAAQVNTYRNAVIPEPELRYGIELDPLIRKIRDPVTGKRIYAVALERKPGNTLYHALAARANALRGKWNARLKSVVFEDPLRANEFANLAWRVFNADPTLKPRFASSSFFRRIFDWARGVGGSVKAEADASRETTPLEPKVEIPEDQTTDFRDFLAANPDVDPYIGAALWALARGLETGTEHFVVVDPFTGEAYATTNGAVDYVNWPKQIDLSVLDPDNQLHTYHNHPDGTPSSPPDFNSLVYPGIKWGVVFSHNGISALSLTQQMRQWLWTDIIGNVRNGILEKLWYHIADKIAVPLRAAVERGELTPDQANEFARDTVHRVMDAAGIADHISSFDPQVPASALGGRSKTDFIRDMGHEVAREQWGEGYDPAAVDARVNRAARVVLPDEGLAEVSRRATEAAESRRLAGGAPDRIGAEGVGETRGVEGPFPEDIRVGDGAEAVALRNNQLRDEQMFGEGGRFPGLIDTRFPDATDIFTRAALDEAGLLEAQVSREDPFDAARALGTAPLSPGAGKPRFNLLNKLFTFPRTVASRDRSGASARFYNAWLGKRKLSRTFFNNYNGPVLEAWQNLSREAQDLVWRVLEVYNATGTSMPMDGRAIAAHNDVGHHLLMPFGQTEVLRDPQLIKAAITLRNALNQTRHDALAETARQYNWHGDPSAFAISEAIKDAEPRERGQLKRLLGVISAIEYAYRKGYIPNMRSGDYYFRITPNAGTPFRQGVAGHTGVPGGVQPTVYFGMLDSKQWYQKFWQGNRSAKPADLDAKVTEALNKLGLDPSVHDQYHVEHGWMSDFMRSKDFSQLDIPALDRLMFAIRNDVRRQFENSLQRTDPRMMSSDPKEVAAAQADAKRQAMPLFNEFVDTMLDEIRKERAAGPQHRRQGIPGYSQDFSKSVTDYFRWAAYHNADIRLRDQIDAARQEVEGQDPSVAQYWREWERSQEEYNDPLYGPLNLMRQYAFHSLLGMNLASTVKILFHPVMLGWPTLSTGLNPVAVGATYSNLFQQALRLWRLGRHGIEMDPLRLAGNDDERGVVQRALDNDTLHPQTTEDLQGTPWSGRDQPFADRLSMLRKVGRIWGSNISAADRTGRAVMLLSAYRTANRVGMARINEIWDRDQRWATIADKTPEAFAQFMVEQTAGIMGDFNRLPIARNSIMRGIFQFHTFEATYLSNMWQLMTRMGPEGKIAAGLMLGGLWAAGGLMAFPFAKDTEEAGTWAYNTLNDKFDFGPPIGSIEGALHDVLDATLGDGWGDEALKGLPRQLGVDFQGIGFGDLLSRQIGSPWGLLGAGASVLFGQPWRAFERATGGQDPASAIREVMPTAVKHVMDYYDPGGALSSAATGRAYLRPDQLSSSDHAKMALGFTPAIKTEEFERHERNYQTIGQYHDQLGRLENRIANLIVRDQDATDAIAQAQELIADGISARVFDPRFEIARFRSDLRQKIMQRQDPELGSRTERRMGALSP